MLIISLVTVVLVVVLTTAVIRRLKYWTFFRNIPGPKAYPLVGSMLPLLAMEHLDRAEGFIKTLMPYKGLVKFWIGPRPTIYITNAEYAEKFLTSPTKYKKEYYYGYLEPWLGLGLLISTGERWRQHRKMLTPAFHFKILESFVDTFIEKANTMISLLEKHIDGETFNMHSYISNCTLDIICETAMGTSVNAQQVQTEYVATVNAVGRVFSTRLAEPWYHFDWIFRRTSLGKDFYRNLNMLHGFTKKVIQERKEQRKQSINMKDESTSDENIYYRKRKLAFLDLMIEASEDGGSLSDEDIREEVDTFMFEGHDTVSAAIIWTLHLLGEYPHCQETVYTELQEVFGTSGRAITLQDLPQLNYLEMVIKETMRLYPSVPCIGRIFSEDMVFGEHKIPAGTGLNLFIHVLHKNEEYFPNPHKFNPDNFLPTNVQNRHPFAYIPFSAGPRNCIGQKFAMLEMKVVLASILRNYKVETQQSIKEVRLLGDIVSRPDIGLPVRIQRR